MTQAAVERASVEGLEGLTIGGLASETEMRKSSVFSLFGSKEELQRAALEAAVEQFKREVWVPVADEEPALPRLLALCDSWLDYHRREVMPGRLLPDHRDDRVRRPAGPAPRAIAATMKQWLGVLEREAATAVEAGELPAETDPADIAFELNALAAGASYGFQLWRDPEVLRSRPALDAAGARLLILGGLDQRAARQRARHSGASQPSLT